MIMNYLKSDFSPEGFFSFMPRRHSAFEPVHTTNSYATFNNGGPQHSRQSSSSSSTTSLVDSGSETARPADAPFRNWMLELNHSDPSSQRSSTPSSEDEVVSLPSPSNLPFYPRKWRESKKERRARTTFTSPQTQVLEVEYRRSEYISRPRRYELATQLNLKEVQIKIWYQNRRAKDKRIEKASWDRQYRCLGLAAAAAVAVHQFPAPANYRLTTSGQLQHPLHMFPSSATSFPLPLLEHFQQGINRQLGLVAVNDNGNKLPLASSSFSGIKKI